MGIFGDNKTGHCVDCDAPVDSGSQMMRSTACRCEDCRKAWTDRATTAICKAKEKTAARKKIEADAFEARAAEDSTY